MVGYYIFMSKLLPFNFLQLRVTACMWERYYCHFWNHINIATTSTTITKVSINTVDVIIKAIHQTGWSRSINIFSTYIEDLNVWFLHPVALCNLLYNFAINATSIHFDNTQYTTCFDWYWSSSGVCSHTQLSNCNATFTFLSYITWTVTFMTFSIRMSLSLHDSHRQKPIQ
jgi:hypothetical protein